MRGKDLSKLLLIAVPVGFILVLITIVVIGFSGITKNGNFSLGYTLFNGVTATPVATTAPVSETIAIGVTAQDGTVTNYSVNYQSGKTAFDLMKDLQNSDPTFKFDYADSSYGVYITGVNGVKPDSSKAFWEFKVNGVSSGVGVAGYTVQKGDKLEFVYTAVQL